jgi:hypothetical protein
LLIEKNQGVEKMKRAIEEKVNKHRAEVLLAKVEAAQQSKAVNP